MHLRLVCHSSCNWFVIIDCCTVAKEIIFSKFLLLPIMLSSHFLPSTGLYVLYYTAELNLNAKIRQITQLKLSLHFFSAAIMKMEGKHKHEGLFIYLNQSP